MTDQIEIPFGQPAQAEPAPIGEIHIADRDDAQYFGPEQILTVECEFCGFNTPRDTFAAEGCKSCGKRGGVV